MEKINSRAIAQKIARFKAGGKPRVLDLFAGCGGLSLGLQKSGFEIAAAIEFDPDAARSHGINFHEGSDLHSKARDITKISPAQLTAELKLGHPSAAFDIIVGGPPCQAFARVGRSKLREVAEHPEAFRHDPRARLYIEYLNYVTACAPMAVLMENVPDILNHGGHNIAEEVCEVLEAKGYIAGYTLLNAAYYGVPQTRERMFLIAYAKEVADQISFPKPTHWINLPSGYEGSRAVALKMIAERKDQTFRYHKPPVADNNLPTAITVEEAIGDLPKIDARKLLASGHLVRGARRFDKPIPYPKRTKLTLFAKIMREWHKFEAGLSLKDHVIRYLPRDYPLFARMLPGDQYPEAAKHAEAMFEERIAQLKKEGKSVKKNSRLWLEIRASIVPPYADNKFPNKWRKMEANRPSRTLLAHLGKDGYSHIHYDSDQARTISVREAARLQSFPDGFVFSGTMNPAFRQIGNAVPPLLAKVMGDTIFQTLKDGIVYEADRRKIAGAGRR